MNYKKSCLSVAVASAFLFTASAVSATGGGDPELAVPERRIKYSRAVLFGDSQLDTGNITKEIKVGQSTRSLSMGAPFTPGSGNFAQQLFGMDIVNANPMKFRERFDPPLFSFELSISNDAGGAFDYSDDKVINMAQGGGKLLNSWPGSDKRVYRTLAQAVIDDYFPRGNFLQNIARGVMEKGTDRIIDFMAERELVLVDKISTQPKKYSDLGGGFAPNDIAIIMAGGNDVIEQGYSKARRDTDIALVELAQARERLLDDVASLGAKNIFFANIPDIGVTPTLLNWEEGGLNPLHLGEALEKSVAEEKINKLTSALNIQTTVAALNSTLKHSGPDGVIVTLVDIHRLIRAVAKEKDRYGLYGDLSGDCDSDVSCKNSKAVEDVIFLTQDGLHPSEKTSKIFAKAYLDYLHAPNAAISARKHGDVRYDASRDAFVNLTTIFHDGTLSHHVDGGLLDLSFQDQVNALTEQVKLSAAVLYFNQKSENYNGSAYTHQLDSDLLLSDSTDGGGGIDVAGEDAELKFTGSAIGGPFLKTGLGKLILLGDSAPEDTYIANGSLQVGDGGEKGSLQGDVKNDARLAFNHSADRIFAGNVTGAGLLMKQGSGTLALTGDHQHSGGTVISEGVLQVGDGGEKGSLQGDVQNDSSLVFNRGNYLEFGGRIDGVGSLVKDGVGLLNLTGEGSMSGRTYVQRGGLGFNGLYDSTDVLVNRDAYVYGVGRVGSLSLDAGGMIKPGNSIGTFSVLGDAIFNKGSVYSVEVNAHGDSDMINVGGVTYLYGGDVLVDAESGDYRPENLYKILLAEGGVEGEFDSVSANFAFLEPHLKYTDSNVLLALARNDLRPVDLCVTENQKAVCGELLPLHPAVSSSDGEEEQKGRPDASDNARPSDKASGNLLAQESAVIIGMSRPEFMELSTSLTGEIHPSVQTVLLRDSSLLRDSAFGRLHETEKGAAGLGSWGYAFGSDGRQRAGHGVSSINHSTHGFVLGQDVLIDDDLVLGVVGGYQKASMSQGLASADINTYNIGVFGSKRYNSVSMRLGGALSWHEIETKRKIYYKSSVVTPNADYSGHSAQLFSEFAYDLKFDQLRVEPYVGLSYTRLDVSSFSEDKKLFSLSGQGEAQDVYASKLGVRANYSVEYNNDISVDLQLGAAWKHLLSDVEPSTDMKFQSYGSDMRISGLPLMKDTAQLTVRLAAQSKSGVSVGLDYILEKAGGLQDQSVSVSASIPF